MTDEMRAAESLVRNLAPTGPSFPIPEPLALDESAWFLTAVDKALIEFTSCPDACARRRHGDAGPDHFETIRGQAHHLFERSRGHGHGPTVLRRELLPLFAAYARAVLDFGYDPGSSVLLGECRPAHRVLARGARPTRIDAAFYRSDGATQLQIKALGDRQRTRRLATAIDASGVGSNLPATYAPDLAPVIALRPRFLWLVGPNSVEPASHVFRLDEQGGDVVFKRIAAVPIPAPA